MKIASAIALVLTQAQAYRRLRANYICIDNWTSVDVNWYLTDELFQWDGIWAPTITSGETLCQDITELANDVYDGKNFNPVAQDVSKDVVDPTYVEIFDPTPFVTYHPDGS